MSANSRNMKMNNGSFRRNKPQNIRHTIGRLFHYLNRYKIRLALVVLFVFYMRCRYLYFYGLPYKFYGYAVC